MSFNKVDVISKKNFQVKSKGGVNCMSSASSTSDVQSKVAKWSVLTMSLVRTCEFIWSSGATSSIFHPHAAKKCCSAHGYKMLHVTHPLNTAANSIFAAFFCFLTIKYTFETWFPCGPRVQQIFAENFMFIILQHVFARKTQQVNWRRKIQIDWVLKRKQRIMGYTGDNKKPKTAEKRGTRRFIGNFQSRSWKKLFMH